MKKVEAYMGKQLQNSNLNSGDAHKRKSRIFLIAAWSALTFASAIGFFLLKEAGNSSRSSGAAGGITIVKSEITETPKFYSYKAGNTKMEVLAVKASGGTIRTAFNTCQVCYSSGRGYYKVVGNTLVCQNCGNVFKFDQVEKEKGGCNPVPILDEDKTDDGTTITISVDYLNQAKQIFANWKKN